MTRQISDVELREISVLEKCFKRAVFLEIKRDALADLLMVRAPITDVELRLTVVPLNNVDLTLPAGLVLLKDADLLDDLVGNLCLRHFFTLLMLKGFNICYVGLYHRIALCIL